MFTHTMKSLCLCFFLSTNAAILQLPIYEQHGHKAYGLGEKQSSLGQPIESFQNLFYKTNISIGTPPQKFDVVVDTTWNDLFVPSVNCKSTYYDQRNQTYNSSRSSTYLEHGGVASSNWAGMSYRGPLSYDTVHLGAFDVSKFLFEEWTSSYCVTIGCIAFGYDGVLGLAPPWNVKDENRPNMLHALLSQKILQKPIFSLELPIDLQDEGKIVFGGVDYKVNSSAHIDLPVLNVTDLPFSKLWNVPASKISFASPHPLSIELPATAYAVLDSGEPYLILPSKFARNLTAAIGARPGPAWFHNIPCERRQELPLLTFTLGGHDFSISAFEYTLEVEPPDGGRVCITTFMDADEFFPPNWDGILLGSPFLRGFQSVWNYETGTVGLAKMKKPQERVVL